MFSPRGLIFIFLLSLSVAGASVGSPAGPFFTFDASTMQETTATSPCQCGKIGRRRRRTVQCKDVPLVHGAGPHDHLEIGNMKSAFRAWGIPRGPNKRIADAMTSSSTLLDEPQPKARKEAAGHPSPEHSAVEPQPAWDCVYEQVKPSSRGNPSDEPQPEAHNEAVQHSKSSPGNLSVKSPPAHNEATRPPSPGKPPVEPQPAWHEQVKPSSRWNPSDEPQPEAHNEAVQHSSPGNLSVKSPPAHNEETRPPSPGKPPVEPQPAWHEQVKPSDIRCGSVTPPPGLPDSPTSHEVGNWVLYAPCHGNPISPSPHN